MGKSMTNDFNLGARGSALSRFTVIDLTRVRSGPACARQLADWGARVIKVEPPGESGDFAARHGPDFQNLHRNKESLTLDLKAPAGMEVFKRLVERADVLLENFRPDVKFRLGLDYETLRRINPRLVYTSISGFGQDGPYRDRPGLDQIAQGMSGLMSVTGEPGRGPMRVGIAISDIAAGLFAALGTLTALLERETSGEGQWVTTSLIESQMFILDFQAARWLSGGDLAVQTGNDHPTAAPMGCFETRDGYLNIAPMPGSWRQFCGVVGLEHLIEDPDFATPEARLRNRAHVNEAVQQIIKDRDSETWLALLGRAGIPCGPVNTIAQAYADEQIRHLGIAQTVVSKKLGPITMNGQPIKMSRSASPLVSAAPEAGENSDEIMEWLGYSAEEIATLRQGEVV